MRTSQHVEWLRHKNTCTTISLHHGSGAPLTTAAGSRCVTSETKETVARVLSRGLVAAETEGHRSKQHSETEQGEHSQQPARVEQAMEQMREELHVLQITMLQQQAVLTLQQVQVTDAAARAQDSRTGASRRGTHLQQSLQHEQTTETSLTTQRKIFSKNRGKGRHDCVKLFVVRRESGPARVPRSTHAESSAKLRFSFGRDSDSTWDSD